MGFRDRVARAAEPVLEPGEIVSLWTKKMLTNPQGTPVGRMMFPVPARGDAKLIANALGAPAAAQ